MQRAIELILVDLRSKSAANGACGSAEGDPVPAAGHVMHSEPLRLKPRHHASGIVRSDAEAVRELFGSQPAVVIH